MHICRVHTFADGEVTGFELGYGPVGSPLMNTYFYLVDGLLIDTGQSNMRKSCLQLLQDKQINCVLLTHHHEDHSGNALALQKSRNLPVYGHPLTAEKLRKGFRILPYQRYTWGKADPLEIEVLPPQKETERFCFIPVHTPGHSKDHTVFLEKEMGWLFSGDLFMGSRIRYFRADEDMKGTIESLQRVLSLDFEAVFCSMSPQPINGKEMLRKKLNYLEEFYREVGKLYKEGYDEKGIIRHLGEEAKLVKFITCGNVSRANMVRSALRSWKVNDQG